MRKTMRNACLLAVIGILAACVAKVSMDKQSFAGKTMQMKAVGAGTFSQKTFEDFNKAWWSSQVTLDQPADAAQPGTPLPVDQAIQAAIKPSDPTAAVIDIVYAVLVNELGLKLVDGPADFLVELDHVVWGMQHHPVALTTYNIFYSATFRITDQRPSGEKPAREWFTCNFKTDSKYSYDEVFADEAAVVRQVMAQAGPACGNELAGKIRAEAASDSN